MLKEAWKRDFRDKHGQITLQLQWGHAKRSMETAEDIEQGLTAGELQWGHAKRSMETRAIMAALVGARVCFNGAMLKEAWKLNPTCPHRQKTP